MSIVMISQGQLRIDPQTKIIKAVGRLSVHKVRIEIADPVEPAVRIYIDIREAELEPDGL